MITPDSSVTKPMDPVADVAPEQIDSYLAKQAAQAGARLVPETGLGAVYCLFGRLYNIRPEVLVAQATQEVAFFLDYTKSPSPTLRAASTHWVKYNNPAEMKYFKGRFDPNDAPPSINRDGDWAKFATKRQGIKAHFDLARAYIQKGNNTVRAFLNAWGTGRVDVVVARANAILAEPKLPGMGIRSDFTSRATAHLASRGMVHGYDGRIRQEWPLTRAEMAAMLTRLFPAKFKNLTPAPAPRDVAGHWAEETIRLVIASGLMAGFPDGTWRPNEPLTRAQTCSIMQRLAIPTAVDRAGRVFADVPPNAWFYNPVMWAYTNGWLGEFRERDIDGRSRFLPDLPISRGEMFHLAYNVMLATGATAGRTGAARVPFVDAIWVAKEDIWVPRTAAGVLTSENETFDMPYTAVPVYEASVPITRRPWLIIGAGAAVAGTVAYLALRK